MLHRIAKPLLFSTLLLAACGTADDTRSRSPAEAAAEVLTDEAEDGGLLITPDGAYLAKNKSYAAFADRVLQTSPLAGPDALRAARLNSEALRQTLTPQFTPSAGLNQDGDPTVRLAVRQVIFTNGNFQAERDVLRAAEIEALANYLIEGNQRVADALLTYAEIDLHRQLAANAQKLEGKYQDLVNQSETRISGGVGERSEIETFQLKLLEARADFQENRTSQLLADDRLRDLTAGLDMPRRPPALTAVAPNSEPPELVLSHARIAAAQATVASERARRRPTVALEAFTEREVLNDITNDGASIGVGVAVPFGFRNGIEIEAAEAELDAAEVALTTSQRDIARRLSQLKTTISRDRQQVGVLRELVAAAEARVDGFDEKFLSGAVSLEEAVSVLETLKRSTTNLAQTENDIFAAQVEVARIQGQLIPGAN